MPLSFQKAQLVGIPNNQNWSQSFVFEPENPEQKENIGSLFGVITVKATPEKEATVVGKEVLAKLEEGYHNGVFTSLNSLKAFLENQETSNGKDFFSATLGLLKGNILYLTATRGQEVVLTRNGKHAVFFRGNPQNYNLRSASGRLEITDTLVFKTEDFTRTIDNDRLEKLLTAGNISETVEKIAPEIHSLEDSSLVAALFLKVVLDEKPPPDVEEITIEEVPSPPLPFLRSEKARENKPLKLIALIIFLLLVGIISVNYFTQKNKETQKNYQEKISLVKKSIKEGTALVEVNVNKAKDTITAGQKTLAELQKKYAKDAKKTAELKKLEKDLSDTLNSVIKIYKVTPAVFYDLTIIKNKGTGAAMSIFEDNLAVLDSVNNSIYLLSLKNKSGEIVGGGKETSGIRFLTLYGTYTYLLNPDKNILQIDNEAKKTKTLISKDNWGNILSFSSFAGNLYLLDSKNNQIWKYVRTDAGFTEVKNYLAADAVPDFSNALSMAIDGSVYLLKKDGLIQKFTQGNADNFNISGLDVGLGDSGSIFTSDEVKNIYILDISNKRITVLGKNGDYKGQYIADLVSKASSFVVSENLGKIFLLAGDKIYGINLK